MDGLNDAALIDKARSGDREAFAALLERAYPFIYRVAYKWCGASADAEDLAQDVCVKLGAAIRSFDGRSAFSSWLYRVTLNTVRDQRKAQARRDRRIAELALLAQAETPEPQADDQIDDLWIAVRDLPDGERDAVLLVYSEGLSHAEAAAVLGCAEGTVAWRISKAKGRLKARLGSDVT